LEEPDEEGVYNVGNHPVPGLPLEKLPDLYGTTFAGRARIRGCWQGLAGGPRGQTS